jgi:hypothetical protein
VSAFTEHERIQCNMKIFLDPFKKFLVSVRAAVDALILRWSDSNEENSAHQGAPQKKGRAKWMTAKKTQRSGRAKRVTASMESCAQ